MSLNQETPMADESSQQFLRELDKKLWSAADRLRANLDAAVYKHAAINMALLLANGSMSSGSCGEGEIILANMRRISIKFIHETTEDLPKRVRLKLP